MYGLVNASIKGLVMDKFGEDAWNRIRERSGVKLDFFVSQDPYPDEYTYDLATAAADELGVSLADVLQMFGEYWVLVVAKEKYGSMLTTGGHTLKEFLLNLPSFHVRVMMIFPDLQPPEFQVSDVEDYSLKLHYYSDRHGLKDFVFGLVTGLGKMYHTPVEIKLLQCRDSGADHEIFEVQW